MNPRFPVLSFVAVLFRVIGALLVLTGVGYFCYFKFINPHGLQFLSSQYSQRPPDTTILLITGALPVLLGLGVVAFGEIIGVLFAIEANTRLGANKT